MPIAVRVVNFGKHGSQSASCVVAPVNADRVEGMAQRSGIREHQYATTADVDALAGEVALDVVTNRALR